MQGVDPATVVGRFIDECWNRGRVDLVDELVSAEFIDHLPFEESMADGIDGLKALIGICRLGFSDLRLHVEDMVAEDDRVVARFVAKGTHDGPFMGVLPSHRQLSAEAIAIYRVEHHQIIDQWCMLDTARVCRQLGISALVAATSS
jgi:steroid delta-isomerase-like uncharacterized protein